MKNWWVWEFDETINRIMSECDKLAQKKCKKRHWKILEIYEIGKFVQQTGTNQWQQNGTNTSQKQSLQMTKKTMS